MCRDESKILAARFTRVCGVAGQCLVVAGARSVASRHRCAPSLDSFRARGVAAKQSRYRISVWHFLARSIPNLRALGLAGCTIDTASGPDGVEPVDIKPADASEVARRTTPWVPTIRKSSVVARANGKCSGRYVFQWDNHTSAGTNNFMANACPCPPATSGRRRSCWLLSAPQQRGGDPRHPALHEPGADRVHSSSISRTAPRFVFSLSVAARTRS
jgi:hypothetical protein